MPRYTIKCRITLSGALMLVEADTPEEALAKVKGDEWDDIEYGAAELVDWEMQGKPELNE